MVLRKKIRKEDRAKSEKGNNIVLSGVKEPTSQEDDEKERKNFRDAEEIMKELTITNAAIKKGLSKRLNNERSRKSGCEII